MVPLVVCRNVRMESLDQEQLDKKLRHKKTLLQARTACHILKTA